MTTRSLFVGLAAAGAMLFAGLPATSQAAPGPVLKPPAQAELVQEAGYYKRRWRYRDSTYVRAPFAEVDDTGADTYVRAPFARVYSGRRGTWVRAPFVNLWVPR
jgi:hypothetical protein